MAAHEACLAIGQIVMGCVTRRAGLRLFQKRPSNNATACLFRFQAAKQWNTLPLSVLSKGSLSSFKIAVKNFISLKNLMSLFDRWQFYGNYFLCIFLFSCTLRGIENALLWADSSFNERFYYYHYYYYYYYYLRLESDSSPSHDSSATVLIKE